MIRFIIRRILAMIPVLFALSVVTFAIIKAPPGDYGDYIRAQLMNQGGASYEKAEEEANVYRRQHGLLDSIPIQYLHWVTGIVTRGDFGDSFFYNQPVSHIVAQRLPATMMLALTCHFFASLLGISFGVLAATQQYRWTDTALSALAFLGSTVPRFLAAIIILYILVFRLSAVEVGSFFSVEYGGAPWSFAKFGDLVHHIWPVVAIATFGGLAYNMRVVRGNLLDTLNMQYVETARAKGLSESGAVLRHALPNALHPLVMYQGVVLPYMLTGEIETAIIFALPTVGPAIVQSMAVGDVNVTATFMLILAATLMVGNIIADVMLALLDPRVRFQTAIT
jgi:peptide/nickel transport system permease protein